MDEIKLPDSLKNTDAGKALGDSLKAYDGARKEAEKKPNDPETTKKVDEALAALATAIAEQKKALEKDKEKKDQLDALDDFEKQVGDVQKKTKDKLTQLEKEVKQKAQDEKKQAEAEKAKAEQEKAKAEAEAAEAEAAAAQNKEEGKEGDKKEKKKKEANRGFFQPVKDLRNSLWGGAKEVGDTLDPQKAGGAVTGFLDIGKPVTDRLDKQAKFIAENNPIASVAKSIEDTFKRFFG